MARCVECGGCRALYVNKYNATCNLGYPIRIERPKGTALGQTIELFKCYPKVKCPKPRTYEAMFDAKRYDGD